MSDEPKPEKPAATPEAIDPKEVRAQLGLPETAPNGEPAPEPAPAEVVARADLPRYPVHGEPREGGRVPSGAVAGVVLSCGR